MPHRLCFTDLLQPTANRGSTFFTQDETKKASFVLPRVVALHLRPEVNYDVPSDVLPSSGETCGGNNTAAAEVKTQATDVSAKYAQQKIVASSSISSCTDDVDSRTQATAATVDTPMQQQTYLFGGFELIANVESVQVHVTKVNDAINAKATKDREEKYLTTCKGIPARDLPPLDLPSDCNSKNFIEEGVKWFKFVFVSPGGPQPVFRVRFGFEYLHDATSVTAQNGGTLMGRLVVRVLKVKCRLADMTSQPSAQQLAPPSSIQPPMPKDDMNQGNLATMITMMSMNGSNGLSMSKMATPSPMLPQQQQQPPLNQQQLQTQGQHLYQYQQQYQQQQKRNHAEVMSSIAGLGMFLRSSEEKTMNSLQTMLSQIEDRIMGRIDALTQRMDAIEKQLSSSSPSSSDTVHEANEQDTPRNNDETSRYDKKIGSAIQQEEDQLVPEDGLTSCTVNEDLCST
jgi:hypothetical protein